MEVTCLILLGSIFLSKYHHSSEKKPYRRTILNAIIVSVEEDEVLTMDMKDKIEKIENSTNR